jgi:nicotinamide riboside kinase
VLAKSLADHYQCEWVPEYARQYLQDINKPYQEADLLKIAKGQVLLEENKLQKAGKFLFSDTEMLVCKIWSEEKFGRCHPWILNQLDRQHYDLYLLCKPDLPWQADPLRENPQDRDRLFEVYRKELSLRKLPFAIVSGQGNARTKTALQAMEDILTDH